MTPAEHHARLAEIFQQASILPPAERGDFIDQMCSGDATLRDELQALLHFHEDASHAFSSMLQAPLSVHSIVANAAAGSSTALDIHAAAISGFRILRLLGEGGMGVVYLAEQHKPRRRVAIKIMRPALATPAMLRRFDLEQEMLARLQHPGIAQIYEAGLCQPFGTHLSPQPYFAMEYIEGLTLTEFAQTRSLSRRERLLLLVRVCDAVQHAHGKGIVHRDLKPANILVRAPAAHGQRANDSDAAVDLDAADADEMARPPLHDATGEPKILDFGVARATGSDLAVTMQTSAGQIVGTLAYMSPEQAAGDSAVVDARSDIYALGAIGYELLAQRLPLDMHGKSIADAARTARDDDPPSLSSIDRGFRGDLDTIFSKALEKDPQRRYQTAAEFALDIRRHLEDQPITARPASAVYTLRKFARRNKGLVAGVVMAFIVLVAGVIGTTLAMLAAQNARTAAENEAETAHAVTQFLQETLSAPDPLARQQGAARDARETRIIDVLDAAAERVGERFADRPLVQAGVRGVLGRTYSHLMVFERAEHELRLASEIYLEHLGEDHVRSREMLSALGTLYMLQHRFDEAEEIKSRIISIKRRTLGRTHDDTLAEIGHLAIMRAERMDYDGALTLLLELYALRCSAHGADDPESIMALYNISWTHMRAGNHAEALPIAREVLAQRERVLGPDHADTLSARNNLGWLCERLEGLEQALAIYEPLIAHARRTMPDDYRLGVFLYNYASALRKMQRFAEAEKPQLEAIDIFERMLGSTHERTRTALKGAADLYEAWGKPDHAAEYRTRITSPTAKPIATTSPE